MSLQGYIHMCKKHPFFIRIREEEFWKSPLFVSCGHSLEEIANDCIREPVSGTNQSGIFPER